MCWNFVQPGCIISIAIGGIDGKIRPAEPSSSGCRPERATEIPPRDSQDLRAFPLMAVRARQLMGRKWGCTRETATRYGAAVLGHPGQIRKNPWGWPNVEARGAQGSQRCAHATNPQGW